MKYVVDIKELRVEQISLCTNFVSRKNIDIDKQKLQRHNKKYIQGENKDIGGKTNIKLSTYRTYVWSRINISLTLHNSQNEKSELHIFPK